MLLSNHNRSGCLILLTTLGALLLSVTFAAADVMCTDAADSMMQSCPDSAPTCCFMGTVPAGCCPYATRCNIEAGSCDTVEPPNNHSTFHQLTSIQQVAYIPNAAFYGSIGGVGGVIVFAFFLGLCTMLCKAHLRERRARLQAEAQTAAEEAAAEAQLLGAVAAAASAGEAAGAAGGASLVHEVDSDEEVEYLREVARRRGGGAAAEPSALSGAPVPSTSTASLGAAAAISGLWGRLRDAVTAPIVGVRDAATGAASIAALPPSNGDAINVDSARATVVMSRRDGGGNRIAPDDDDDGAAAEDDDDNVSERRPLVPQSGGAATVVAVPHVPSLPTTGGSAVSMTREDVMMAALNEDKAAVDAAAALLGLCAVCGERRVQCVGLPCGHLKLCADCARHMRHCPECKAVMKRKIKVFVV